ncbi:phosphate ABC transporter substrate-binding protein [Aliiglaciecola sp. CAU 1673]|uniref:PstS family phosphate ABC transporter substrate-binding protein n=1 Tax=Aliiglaciecola sp. CAU 1673 TaxID=3032595 RepID=UPI0023D9E241|nr:phosphate ABC transporter substrate-binding protein [Aliiglaciecola sp. CAU 1673]MDF2180053.1 phosphate ABC transporter substrate-binding protein [Aliiglaciecola sp. CAU 1673]
MLCFWAGLPAHANPADEYQKRAGVAGNITSVGSDTLGNLMTFWAEEFKALYPHVTFQIQASGSSTAPSALTEGTANLGPMSRELKESEIAYFSKVHGYRPTVLKVAIDAIALFVDLHNPIEGMNLEQIDAIFSVTRYCGGKQPIVFWHQLGLSGTWQDKRIRLFGRNSVSGTYGLFKLDALCEGDFLATVNEQPGSASVVQSVAYSDGALGYAGFGYKTAGVRALPIAKAGEHYVAPTMENIASGDYPLSRFLYLVVNKAPGQSLPLVEQEFLRFILSSAGQDLVRRDGFIPIPDRLLRQQVRIIEEIQP